MPDRRLLYLSQHQMLAYRWQGGHCIPEGSFAAESAYTEFADYLKAHAKSLFTVVTNIAEEGFQQETIPYVQSRDRMAIVQRKLDQAFLGAPLSVAVPLGHEKTRRRNERLLLAALTSGSQLEPWLLALRAAETRLAGIFSLPLLTDALAASLKLPKERCIVVTVQDGTVRQSFLDAGKLVFSRVAPLSSSSIGGIAKSIISEIARLQQYLQTQRLTGRSEVITAHVLLHPTALSALDPALAPTNIEISLVDLHQAARKVGLRDLPEDSRAQTLFLQLAAANPPTHQFATPVLRKHYRIWQFGNALQAIGIVCFMTSAIYAAKLHFDKERLAERSAQMAASAADNERRYQAVLATFPPMPMDNDALRAVVDRLNSVQGADRTPDALLRDLARALDRTPQVELAHLEWIGRPAPEGGGAQPSQGTAAQGASAEDEALAINGTIFAGRSGSPRQLIDLFDQFVEQLRATPNLTVNVLKQPFDVTSGRALKSGETAASAELPREFELRLQRKNPS